jgi:plastocyanin
MNKYIVILILIALILLGGLGYRMFFASDENAPIKTGIVKIVPVSSSELRWEFVPEFMEVDQGDRVVLEIINEDAFDHGFAIDAYGISQRMPAGGSIVIEFDATKAGDFPFYCSVSCGSGIVDGEKRGHFDHIGKMHVRSLISETVSYKDSLSDEDIKQTRRAAMISEASRALGVLPPDIQFDDNNESWLKLGRKLDALEGIQYQALRYEPSNPLQVGAWIFIDTTTGEVITESYDE